MRTKTLVLTALSSFSAIGLMAQSTNVYSLNAVGYINVSCPPGFSIIACQLIASPDNTIGTLLPISADGHEDGCQFFKFNGSGYASYGADSTSVPPWSPNGSATLNPGEAGFFENNQITNIIFTFVGTVPQGTNTVTLNRGFNLVSSPIPQSGGITTVLGLSSIASGNNDGDQLFLYNNTGSSAGYASYGVDSTATPPWSPSEPSIGVGQGFFYEVGSANPVVTWTRVFSVNN